MSNLASIFGGQFVANQAQAAIDARGGQPIPPGTYITTINNAEIKPTKTGTGQYLEVVLEVIDGPSTGRKVYSRLNIVNPNPTAQEIGRRDLNMLVCATGLAAINSADELIGRYVAVRVIVDKDNRNDVKGYMAPSAVNTPPASMQPQRPAYAPQPSVPQPSVQHPTVPAMPVQQPAPAQQAWTPAQGPTQFLQNTGMIPPAPPASRPFAPSPVNQYAGQG